MESKIYKIVFSQTAEKQLGNIPKVSYLRIRDKIDELSGNPRPNGYIKLLGYKDLFRIRVGVYRIIYTIIDNILTVKVLKIAHRKEIYK